MSLTAQHVPSRADRIELILHGFDSLPTLGSVAIRLLELTSDDSTDARDVIDLVASDPSLAAKVLRLCQCHPRGRANNVTTIDRAVLQLGFEAVRCAVLSARVFEVIDGMAAPSGEHAGEQPVFDREAFWLHALADAVVSERIAAKATRVPGVRPGEAFLAGLLHDIGQLVLHVLLPESFDRVCRMAETHGVSLDHACRQVIGLDTHTAGKRMAEHWGLPQPLIDVIWLSGQPFEALPAVPHRALIAVVTLADAVVRNRYIPVGPHGHSADAVSTLSIPLGISADAIDAIAGVVHEEVSARAEAIGLSVRHDAGVLLRAIARANDSLARANAGMRERERVARRQGLALRAIADFHAELSPGATTVDVLGLIARSASSAFGARVVGALFESAGTPTWRLLRFNAEGRPFGSRFAEVPEDAIPIATLVRDVRGLTSATAFLPWLEPTTGGALDARGLLVMALPSRDAGAGSGAMLLVEEPRGAGPGEPQEVSANSEHAPGDHDDVLIACWRAALAAGAQHDGAVRLSEQLAAANRDVLDMQEALARTRTLHTLGEVAAGCAHEMNNPLTIISGRSQLLATQLEDGSQRRMAVEIEAQSHKLSDMITALRSFTEPVSPRRRSVDLADLALRVVQQWGPKERREPEVSTTFTDSPPAAFLDPELIGCALGELVRNAGESKGCRHIELRVQIDPLDDRLRIEVRDDGSGLDERTLRHAFDPFFSAKPAGRQPGLGLARARRYVEAHGGRITLVNGPAAGAVATIWLPGWRVVSKAESGMEGSAEQAPPERAQAPTKGNDRVSRGAREGSADVARP